ncbi:signal peptide peptidase SppA [Romeria aff. gracilis LEGE 07310]|uniref:Protease 4 n=1 Tax=Vasconcelosia minhoensis LEGE 07310 TaxID=915328 RepID=A0A8J7DQ50_9CYAN|nr:signal peptide peptidase SppA [Romeria gracilis]MBE9075904.1 signal peptide peptidase SppA [Romeria aff. gracilis LEGE 07310]
MRDFLKYAAASALGTLIGLFTLVVLLGMGAVGLVSVLIATSSSEAEPELAEKSILVFDLSTNITDSVPYDGAGALFEGALGGGDYRSVSLYSVLQALAAAAEDDNVVGLYLTGHTDEGFATLQEVRQALTSFKESGKPIWAYETDLNERDYYLTSAADTLVLNPAGIIEVNGFRAEIQFLANALKKYGIGVQVLRVGRFKSAVEPFIRTESSPEERQQTQDLLSGLWQNFLQTVSADRELTAQQLQQIADAGGLVEAEQAQAAGLVDRVAFYDEVLAELQDLTEARDEDDFPQTTLYAYSRLVNERSSGGGGDEIAIVYAEGNIISGEGGVSDVITDQGLTETLRRMRRDDDVGAVVLRVNSPGGSALASEIIAHEVELLAQEKPVVISMGDFAASGGYMISAPGTIILAEPTTITGSIGVFGLLLNIKEIANRNGITWDVIKTAQFADIDTIARPQSEAELKIQQDYVNSLYDRFVTLVAEGRDVTKERVNQVAQGRVWTGMDAVQADLVDQLGGLGDAIAVAAEAAELEDWQVEEYPRPLSLEEQIFGRLFNSEITSRLPWKQDPLTDEIIELRQNLQVLEQLNDPNHAYTRLPFTTEIE